MKITRRQLRQIIKEEMSLLENNGIRGNRAYTLYLPGEKGITLSVEDGALNFSRLVSVIEKFDTWANANKGKGERVVQNLMIRYDEANPDKRFDDGGKYSLITLDTGDKILEFVGLVKDALSSVGGIDLYGDVVKPSG